MVEKGLIANPKPKRYASVYRPPRHRSDRCAIVVRAQIPEKFTNLQFFPKDIPRYTTLVATMRGVMMALGVRCNYCHTGGDGRSLQGVDFASDDKIEKQKARQMFEIVRRINGELLSNMPERESPPLRSNV